MMSKQDMENINSDDESDHDLISTEMLEDIRDVSQTHLSVKSYLQYGKSFTQGI